MRAKRREAASASPGEVGASVEEPVSRPKAHPSRRDILIASGAYAAAGILSSPPRAARSQPLSASLVDAARREGAITFYTAMELSLAETLKKRFETQYPEILVRLKRSGAERIFERIDPEGEEQLRDVDVICTSDAGHFVHWKREGRLTKYVPDQVANHLPSEEVDPDGMFATVFGVLSVIGYNSRLVSSERAPKRFVDLLIPEWKGKIVKARPDYSGIALVATFQIVRALGWSFFEQLAMQNVKQVNSAAEPPNELARGEIAIQADGAVSNLLLLKERGAPVQAVYPSEGTPTIPAPSAIFKSAPHPSAARLFQNFLFSAETQQLLVQQGGLYSFHNLTKETPGRPSVGAIKLLRADAAEVESERDTIIERYKGIFGSS
jgi:iron(III) transport system substrate-binding protein